MKNLTRTIVLFCFFSSFIHGQNFSEDLEKEADLSVSNLSAKQVDLDSFKLHFFQFSTVKMTIDPFAKYQVLFSEEIKWESRHGENVYEMTTENKREMSLKMNKNEKVYKDVSNSARIFRSDELINGLEIDLSLANTDKFYTEFPVVFEREDPLNHQWTTFSNSKFLILRFVHSYPNGNYRSFYFEKLYYFKKIE